VRAALPVNGQEDLSGFRVDVHDNLFYQRANHALLQSHISAGVVPYEIQVFGQRLELLDVGGSGFTLLGFLFLDSDFEVAQFLQSGVVPTLEFCGHQAILRVGCVILFPGSVGRVACRVQLQPESFDHFVLCTGRFLRGEVGDNNGDNYSCRWTGFLQPTHSEEYTLTFEVNDGGRVWFDGRLVIDAWDKPQTASASVGTLTAGKLYPIRVEHHKGTFEKTGRWKALLYWETPTVERRLIPPGQFYLPEGFVEPAN